MIRVVTASEKRALAAALAEHNPEFLQDLKMISGIFGKQAEVYYRNENACVMQAITNAIRKEK